MTKASEDSRSEGGGLQSSPRLRPSGDDTPATAFARDPGSLVEQSYTWWLLGEWAPLAALTESQLEADPQRGFLTALSAAALAQRGEIDAARQRLNQAMLWGCGTDLALRLMASGLAHTLGGLAGRLDRPERAADHYRTAMEIGAPGNDAALLAEMRRMRQSAPPAAGTALPPGRTGKDDKDAKEDKDAKDDRAESDRPAPSLSAYNRYATLPTGGPFMLLETKSLPRSGLHYMKGSLERLVGRGFSFCEWYQEPGCCHRTPCAMTAYAETALKDRRPVIRMIKSHDFRLADPDTRPQGALRRMILVRDPVYILTSWWLLNLFHEHAPALRTAGLTEAQLYYNHDKATLAAAYRTIERRFDAEAARDGLDRWLDGRCRYIREFTEKWARSTRRHDSPAQRILRYEDMADEVLRLMRDLGPLAPDQAERVDAFAAETDFRNRKSPYAGPVPGLTAFLEAESGRFAAAARRIARQDDTGLLGTEA